MGELDLKQLLGRLGWRWTHSHLLIYVDVSGHTYRVAIPVSRVDREVGRALPGVGWSQSRERTSVGFWKKLTRSVKRLAKPLAKRVVPKAIRTAAHRLERQADRAIRTLAPIGRSIIRSKALSGALLAASFIPGAAAITAPALAAQLAARQALEKIEAGYQAIQRVTRGARDVATLAQARQGQAAQRAFVNVIGAARGGNPQAVQFAAATRHLLAAQQ